LKIAAPENVVSGLLAPLAGAGRLKPGLVSRLDHGNTHLTIERDTSVTSTKYMGISWKAAALEGVASKRCTLSGKPVGPLLDIQFDLIVENG
jgi:hypothetical protein